MFTADDVLLLGHLAIDQEMRGYAHTQSRVEHLRDRLQQWIDQQPVDSTIRISGPEGARQTEIVARSEWINKIRTGFDRPGIIDETDLSEG